MCTCFLFLQEFIENIFLVYFRLRFNVQHLEHKEIWLLCWTIFSSWFSVRDFHNSLPIHFCNSKQNHLKKIITLTLADEH